MSAVDWRAAAGACGECHGEGIITDQSAWSHCDCTRITEPCVVDGLPDALYHRDPVPGGSLSASGAKLLLPPSCPAKFAHQRTNPPTPKPEFDLGHAAHLQVLGVGADLVVVDAPDWRTKAAREARAEAHAAGKVPLLAEQHQQVQAMAEKLRQHPIAGELLDPERMIPERSLFWADPETEVWRRARLDATTRPDTDGPLTVVDYKSCKAADHRSIEKAMWDYGYAAQASWYLDAASYLIEAVCQFFFVFQEVTPPYLVSVVEPDAVALRIGHRRNREAIEIYRQCVESGHWPGYTATNEIPLVSVPAWAARQHDDEPMEIL